MTLLLDSSELKTDIANIFVSAGLDPKAAVTVSDSLVEADRLGLASHGCMLADMYVKRLQAGSVSAVVTPDVVTDAGATAVLDGRHGFGVLSADFAMNMAVAKAKQFGVGVVSVRHAFHFGTARRFAIAATEQNCVGIAMCNTRPLMPAPGGAQRVVGNNPIAIAIPTTDEAPLVLDMATSEAAMGKIRMAAKKGEQIPASWAVKADGSPTTDPNDAINGMLLPTAGPKGFGLSLSIDLLCGILSGGAMGADVMPLYGSAEVPYDCSHVLIAINVDHFGDPSTARERVAAFSHHIRDGAKAPGVERLYTPGEPEWQRRKNWAEQVPMDPSVLKALGELARDLGTQLKTNSQA